MSQGAEAQNARIRDTIAGLSTPIFFAGASAGNRPWVTLHAAKERADRRLRRDAERALARAGIEEARCEVRALNSRQLDRARSLERLVRLFDHEVAIYDPTGSVGRAGALVRYAGRVRQALGRLLCGVYFVPRERTLCLVLDRNRMVRNGRIDALQRRGARFAAAGAMRRWRAEDVDSFEIVVHLVFDAPRCPLVAVDAASLPYAGWSIRLRDRLREGAISAAVAGLFGIGLTGTAMADGPAVSDPNAKISLQGGVSSQDGIADGEEEGFALGSGTIPLGQNFGAQVDLGVGTAFDELYWGVGGHLFWRDPRIGLFGPIGSYEKLGDGELTRYGAEAELYLGRVTLMGRGGYQDADEDEMKAEDGIFGRLDVSLYPIDNLRITAGGEYASEDWLGRAGIEVQLGWEALPGLSLFAEGQVGEDDFERAFAGFRYYFGKKKTLIRRHREDDPISLLVTEWQLAPY